MKNGKKWLAFVAACMSLVATVLVAGCTQEQQYAASVGNFYSLEEAYENGWLTRDDILSIAYYYNQGAEGNEALMGESYAPEPTAPEMLDEERANQIKRTYLNDVIAMPEGTFEHVIIRAYYGTYHENIVIHITDDYHGYDYVSEPEYEIGGVRFYDYVGALLRVWRADATD
ncbi:MAG TPA: hypothetical protein H9812_05140 [Candidatus Gallimonas intestinigallinarum]|uniref:Lipoprotein n=1 Tax=Candidatus Gallimonas intestinigallinarum TaxID=2838604 RepID=A0A9D2DXE0_9FIRM|nr:hypothetical protein [Candidatus Gallimonas intestinigallinarum]